MRVCVVGAGALGSTIGGTLAAGGCEVRLVDSYAAHVAAINEHGLVMLEAGQERTVPVRASADVTGFGLADLVIILVKSFHTREAVEAASSAIGAGTAVMSLQNGLGHEDIIAEAVGRERVLAGKTYVGGVFLGPGRVRSGVSGKETVIGELTGGSTSRVERIAAAMNAAGLLTVLSPDIVGTMWDKLLINVAGGALTAITRLTYGGLYSLPELEVGGVQLMADPGFNEPEGRLAHLGIMVEDQAAVLREAASWGVTELPQGPNWLRLPDGLCIEILQATGTAVAAALAIDPRA